MPMNQDPIPSVYYYESLMEAVEKFQGQRSAIIILENPDGTTTYLRYKISEEDTVRLLNEAFSHQDERNHANTGKAGNSDKKQEKEIIS